MHSPSEARRFIANFNVHKICCCSISGSADKDRKLHIGEVPMYGQHHHG